MKRYCDQLIKNSYVLDEKGEVQKNFAIAICNDRIAEVGSSKEVCERWESTSVWDGHGRMLWMPGLIDAHMHTGQQLLKGKILDALPMIWTRIMLPFESQMTPEKMRLSAELAALEMIHAGTTSFIDAGSYYMEEAASVYEQAKLRGALSVSTMDAGNLPDSIADTAQSALERTNRLYEQFHGVGNLQVFYSLRSLISCSETLMELVFETAEKKNTKVQAHMNEYPNEVNFFLERKQMRPIEFLQKMGWINQRFISAHSLLLSTNEMDILKESGASVVHCPFSNCGKAIPETPQLLERKIPAALGTDGAAHGGLSLFNEMKIFRSIMNARYAASMANPAVMPAKVVIEMATKGGASVLGMAEELGTIEQGKKADLISINFYKPHLFPSQNQTHTIMECVNAGDINDMIVNGKTLMKDKIVLTLDEEKILYEAEKYMELNQ